MQEVESTEQAQRFTISPSGRLIAIFPNRAVNGLITYAYDDRAASSSIDFRSAGDNGVPVDERNIPLTCSVESDGRLSCGRGPTANGPSFGPTTAYVQCPAYFNAMGLGGDSICTRSDLVGTRRDVELRVAGLTDTFFCDAVAFASE